MTDIKREKLVKQIEEEYGEKAPDRVDELKKLDAKVQTPPQVLAYTLGILGALVLGVGMCVCLEVIASGLMPVGVVVGVVGIGIMIANVFIYRAFLAKRKKKYGKQVLDLVNELKGGDGRAEASEA